MMTKEDKVVITKKNRGHMDHVEEHSTNGTLGVRSGECTFWHSTYVPTHLAFVVCLG